MLIISILIRVDSEGPAIFSQERVGGGAGNSGAINSGPCITVLKEA
jgi:hypothetical protein